MPAAPLQPRPLYSLPTFQNDRHSFFLFPNEMQLENVKEKGQTVAAKGKLQ